MPVTLQHIHSQTDLHPRDREDLELLRGDHPAPGATAGQRFGLAQWLVAGRFNGRILAACWLTGNNAQWRIEDLSVRAMTRRRGVARQLLTLLGRDAARANCSLVIAADPTLQTLAPLLTELGFIKVEPPDRRPDWVRPPL